MRRIHIPALINGITALPPDQAHHLRDVLRLHEGEIVEAFDNAGNTARATLSQLSPAGVTLRIDAITPPTAQFTLTIASAIPKGPRADWMIEKLSELGVHRFIPLITERSVVIPQGQSKITRWNRIATESAKQSRRVGVMQIDAPLQLIDLPTGQRAAYHLSTNATAAPLHELTVTASDELLLLIGPEGGWTEQETEFFARCNIPPARLTNTILRIETAAIAAAAVIASRLSRP